MSGAFASTFLASSVALQQLLPRRAPDLLDAPSDVLAHLTGIFVAADGDGDGFINRQQLDQALGHVGLAAREGLVKRYIDAAFRNSPARRASVSSPPSRRLSLAVAPVCKIDLLSFVSVTYGEMDKVKLAAKEIEPLLKFMTMDNLHAQQDRISVGQLRHLLVETLSPTRLSDSEFRILLDALGVAPRGSSSDSVFISLAELKRHLLLQV